MSPAKAIVFDSGGVLVKNVKDPDFETLVVKNLGHNSLLRAYRGEITDNELWRALDHKTGITAALYVARPVDQRVFKLARSLTKKYPVGVLSNGIRTIFKPLAKKYKYKSYFSPLVLSAEVGLAKPDPKIYRLILKQLGVRPSELLFIDDRAENVIGAKKLGIRAFRYTGKNFTALLKFISKHT